MQHSVDTMKLALRVLSAITGKQSPAAADLDELRTLAPDMAERDADDLACEVIHRALRRRAQIRDSAALLNR